MHPTYKKWLEDGCPKVFCHCPNHEEIVITKQHKYDGIPKYVYGHNSKGENNPMFGKHHSEETRQKIGKKSSEKRHTEKTKQKMRENNLGENNPMFGRTGKKSPRFGIKGELHPSFGTHPSEETLEKLRGKFGDKNPNWKNGASFGKYCPKFNNKKKEEIRNEFDRKCFLCGKEEKDNITKSGKVRKLSVHHIDADKEQGCNGKPFKLIPLCLKCHGKVHNHKIEEVN